MNPPLLPRPTQPSDPVAADALVVAAAFNHLRKLAAALEREPLNRSTLEAFRDFVAAGWEPAVVAAEALHRRDRDVLKGALLAPCGTPRRSRS
ncbi:MAG: hypothetical protein HOV68_05265 [Streptomycetaceae bacterium]|nr:hypothetical protein [Streptomycetaceae bacterium]